jgi:hypothetical protein
MIAAKLANMSVGGDKKSSEYQTANLQNDNVSQAEGAKLLNVSELEQCMSLVQLTLGQ